MQFQYTPYILPLLTIAIISAAIAIYAWLMGRATVSARALAVLSLTITVWSVGYALEITGTDLPTKIFWGKMQYPGIVTIPLMWLIFTVNHFNQSRRLTLRNMAALAIIPLITVGLVFTTETHGLVWKETYINQVGKVSTLGTSYGSWFWVHSAYAYLLLLTGAIVVFRSLSRRQGLYRGQAGILIIGVLAPWIGNILYLSGMNPIPPLDLTPFAFTITILAFTWGIFGFQLIEIAPIARDIVVEEMADGIVALDTHGHIADINPSAERIINRSAAQVIGQPFTEVFSSWPQPLVEQYPEALQALDQVIIGEEEAQHWYELRLSPLYSQRQRLIGRVITIRDITEQKRTEEALAQQHNLLRTVIDNVPDQIFARDTDSRFTMGNKSDARAMGIDNPEMLIGKNDYDFYPPELAALYQADNRAVMESGQPIINREEPSRSKEEGQLRWTLTTKVPLRDPQGEVIGLVGITHDITEQKRAEEQLRQLARAVEASPASIVITDHNGKIQYVNPKFTHMTGYTASEALGENPRILKTNYTSPEIYQLLWQTIKSGHEWRGEFCNRKKNGEVFWELASISPIIDPSGNITHYVAVKEDITERKKMEEALAQARDQALATSNYKSELLAKVSHELRTPLGVILGYTEFLHDEMFAPLTDKQKHFTTEILNSTAYLNNLITDLLDQSHIEQGKIRISLATLKLQEILDQLTISLKPMAEAKGLAFTTSLDLDLPATISGDQKRLLQILTNLTNNAIKFTESGSVTASIFRIDQNYWAMQVADTGPGIPQEVQTKIFSSFWQMENSLINQHKGYGLGLSIVQQLIDLMGGKITLKSEPGQGSTFTVMFPLEPIPPNVIEETLLR